MKKLIVCMLALMVLFCIAATMVASGSEEHQSGDYKYTILTDGTAKITKYSGSAGVLDIPSELDGRRVTSIGKSAFEYSLSLTVVTIPDSVTSIGDSAFDVCNNLTSVNIPDSVTSIGNCAFHDCGLTSITIPDSVTYISGNPFCSCDKLSAINVNPEHPYLETIDGVLFSKPDRRLVCCPCALDANEYIIPQGTQTIVEGAFTYNRNLISITIPDSVIDIYSSAFANCYRLTSIDIPDGITYIAFCTFMGCEKLASVTIPNSVTSIGSLAFEHCKSLTSVTIPDNVTSINSNAFFGCNDALIFYVEGDSYGKQYCEENGFRYELIGIKNSENEITSNDPQHVTAEVSIIVTDFDTDRYYSELKNTKYTKNPLLDVKIYDAALLFLRNKGMSKAEASSILDKVKAVPEKDSLYRDLFLWSLMDHNIVFDVSQGDPEYYDRIAAVHLREDHTSDISTFFHEIGHAIDGNLLRRKQGDAGTGIYNEVLYNALREDVRKIVKSQVLRAAGYGDKLLEISPVKAVENFEARVSVILNGTLMTPQEVDLMVEAIMNTEQWSGSYDEDRYHIYFLSMVYETDVPDELSRYEGVWERALNYLTGMLSYHYHIAGGKNEGSANMFADAMDSFCHAIIAVSRNVGGHTGMDPDYWTRDKQLAEPWAEYYSSMITGEHKDSNKELFKESCAIMDEMAHELLEGYKRKHGGA